MTHYWFYVINCRGDRFRREFSRLGELRSIIPEHVHVMALTATATVSTRKEIIKSLDVQDPVIVSVSPMKESVHAVKTTLSEKRFQFHCGIYNYRNLNVGCKGKCIFMQ